ncbi:dephospho-CoA kinase [Candidatus Poribacteria bacterium]|nr:dephospho-CoA kinase [Candidatus Poribacteria bacterium]
MPNAAPIRRIGLTGGMACGKSTVAAVWRELGAHVLSSDATVHELLAMDASVQREVREAFGQGVFDAAGAIDRAALGRVVFHDEPARQRLMAILHPRTIARHTALADAYLSEHPDGVVVVDSPLLFESGLDRHMDAAVVVAAPHDAQIERAMARARREGKPLTRDEAERRIALQMPLDEKRQRATYVIENDGTLDELNARARALWWEMTR